MQKETDLVVLGSGPGGYTAAFRAADLGQKVILVEKYPVLGGVCLNVGCIPSKAHLHMAKVIEEADKIKSCGIAFDKPHLDFKAIRQWVNSVVTQLTSGLKLLSKKRKVEVVEGIGTFSDTHTLSVKNSKGETTLIHFKQAIIAAGSSPIQLPNLPKDPRIMTSTDALQLKEVPQKLLIIGGGIIGLEMAMFYHAYGSNVTVVEMSDQLIPPADADIVKPLYQKLNKLYKILLNTKVISVTAEKKGLAVQFEGTAASTDVQYYDRILSAVGRTPNGHAIGADNIGLAMDSTGFIPVDTQLRTNIPHIFAIGDIVGQPMLAHKASAQAKVAAEIVSGKSYTFEPRCIPSVAYTSPELAWVGITEKEAKAKNIAYGKGVFPWKASGRALTQQATEGMTKLLFNPKTQQIIGGGVVGAQAGELITEIALAIEMGCTVQDIELTIHPHPTLSETSLLAAEMYGGTITDLLPVKE